MKSYDAWSIFAHKPTSIPLETEINGSLTAMPFRGKSDPLSDLWEIGKKPAEKETLLNAAQPVIEKAEYANAMSNIAQAVIQTLSLMVFERQLYYQNSSIWSPLNEEDFPLIWGERSENQKILSGLTERSIHELYQKIKAQPSIQRTSQDIWMDSSLIPFLDGVFDLECMEAREVKHDDYFFSCNSLSVEEIGRGDGKMFEGFMEHISNGNPAIRQQILELIGIVISGYKPKNFFLLVGPGDTGKSQVLHLLEKIVGESFVQSISNPNELSGKWMFSSLEGKRLCSCPDTAQVGMSQKTIAAIKQMTGGDRLQAEKKYGPIINIVNEATLVFASNYPLRGLSDKALLNRMVTIPFLTPIPKEQQIPNFSQHLYQERGYIVGQAIQALDQLRRRNFTFTVSDEKSFASISQSTGLDDAVVHFVETRCELTPDAKESTQMLYTAFLEYAEHSGVETVPSAIFARTLSKLFPEFNRCRDSQQRGFEGIRLKGT